MTIKGFKQEDYFNFIDIEYNTKYLVSKEEYLEKRSTPDVLITCLPTMPIKNAFAPDPIAEPIKLPVRNLRRINILKFRK